MLGRLKGSSCRSIRVTQISQNLARNKALLCSVTFCGKNIHTQTQLNFPITNFSYTFQLLLMHCVFCELTSAFSWRRTDSEGYFDGSDLVTSGVPRNFLLEGGGVQQILLWTEDRENGDVGAVAP